MILVGELTHYLMLMLKSKLMLVLMFDLLIILLTLRLNLIVWRNERLRFILHWQLLIRNVFDEWGLELKGGFGDGQSFMGGP